MNRGFIRTLFLFVFIFCSTFSLSFAGVYDKDASSFLSDTQSEILSSSAYAAYSPEQKTETNKEISLFSDFIKKFPQTQPTALQYQIELQKGFKDAILEPLRKSLQGNLSDVPYQLEQITSALVDTAVADSNNPTLAGGGAGSGGPIVTTDSAKQAARSNLDKATKPIGKCDSLLSASIGDCISVAVSWIINNTLLQIAGFLVWVTANMFNYSIQIGILNFAQWAPDSLYPIWIIIRQIVSLLIVFVGLYLGFMYILGKEERFEKYIPWVIIFALFVNFSYPLARTAIDISNIISLKVYSSAIGNNALTAGILSQNTAGALIMNRLGLQGLVMSAEAGASGSSALTSMSTISGALLAVVYVLFAAYIFLMATGIMVLRTAALVFLTIASPILFIDSVLPVLGERAKQVRKIFFEQLAVGPIFMIMLALTLKFLDVFSSGPMAQVTGTTGDATIKNFFNILMMLVMLYIMLKVTKETSGTLGEYATNAMGKVGGFGLGVATGGAGFLARGTIGAGAMKLRDSKWVTNNQDSFLGRRTYDLSNSLAKSSMDLRNSNIVAGKMNKLGMGMGMGAKMGYEASAEAKRKEIATRGGRIKTRFERDVYSKDGKLIARKGDVDTDSEAAEQRYTANAGGALFMTKEQKDKAREVLAAQNAMASEKRIAEAKKNSLGDIRTYNSIKEDIVNPDGTVVTVEEQKNKFAEELNKELERIQEIDPELRGQQAQSLLQSKREIDKKRGDSNSKPSNASTVPLAPVTPNINSSGEKPTEEPLDIDLTEKSPETIRKEKQQAAAAIARQEMGTDVKPQTNTTTPQTQASAPVTATPAQKPAYGTKQSYDIHQPISFNRNRVPKPPVVPTAPVSPTVVPATTSANSSHNQLAA